MSYKNPLLAFADRSPMLGFFGVPVAIYYGSVLVSAMIRKGKTGSYIAGNPFAPEDAEGALAGLGALTEGGSPSDMVFRATASTAPTKRGTTVGDEIQSRPQGGNIRYDRNYHDSVFMPNLDYEDNNPSAVHQTYGNKVTDSYVFAGISGMNKLR